LALVTSTSSLGGFAGGAALARLLVVFSGDVSQLERAVARAQGSISGFGQNASAIGGAMTRSLTLPILAAGGAATFLATRYAASIGRVAALTPILETTGQSIDDVSNQILELSQVVPTGPIELADALYFAGSAGLDAATAMQVVELAAKGAAIGMGEASDIAKVLIFSLNAFEEQGLTATEAMDALTVAIREGTVAPEDLAVALGRLLPIAKEAGITFQEVVGAVASLTNIGFPARVATVALRALFSQLLAPTIQAKDRLDSLGVSADQLRDAMRFGGPIAAFELLNNAVGGNEDALRDIMPQIRGFSAFVGITGDRLDETVAIMEKTTNATGATERAFQRMSETPAVKFQLALNKAQVAAIDIGNAIIPIFNKLGEVVGGFADAIAGLPEPLQKTVVGFLGVVAAMGPMLKLFGNMGALTGTIISGFGQISTTAAALGVSILVLVGSFQSLADGSRSLFSILSTVAAGAFATFSALRLLQGAANAGLLGVNALSVGLVGLSTGGLAAVALGAAALITTFALVQGSSQRLARDVDNAGQALLDAAKAGSTLRTALQGIESEEVRQDFLEIARSLHLLDDAAGEALPRLSEAVGAELQNSMVRLNGLLQENANVFGTSGVAVDDFVRNMSLASRAADQGVVLAKTFDVAGVSVGDFFDQVSRFEQFAPDEAIRSQAGEVLRLAQEYPELVSRLAAYEQAQFDTIAATAASQGATEDYARELGVSAEFLQSHLDAVGVSAAGMTEDNKRAFEALAFTVDENAGQVSARISEMEALIAESAQNIRESIADSFSGFERADVAVGKSTDKLLQIFRDNARGVVQEVTNLRTLAERGVPANVLEFLAEQGPGFVQRFVDASDRELDRLVVAYQTRMAAIDSAIIEESLHQKRKGESMVEQFVSGILTNDDLPPGAAREIIQNTTEAFARGDISQEGLKLALQFATGLRTMRGISRQEGAAAISSFIEGLRGRDLSSVGERQVTQFAQGLSQNANIPVARAREMLDRIITTTEEQAAARAPAAGKMLALQYAGGVQDGRGEASAAAHGVARAALNGLGGVNAYSQGLTLGNTFAAGIRGALGTVADAISGVAGQARTQFDNSLEDSPTYFTYHVGEALMKQMGDGMRKEGFPDLPNRPRFGYPLGSADYGRMGVMGGGRHRSALDVDVTIDRRNVAREVDWDWRADGR
jgi:TP901 family phage tail tape measure protein